MTENVADQIKKSVTENALIVLCGPKRRSSRRMGTPCTQNGMLFSF
jgi:hypothetical protein